MRRKEWEKEKPSREQAKGRVCRGLRDWLCTHCMGVFHFMFSGNILE